MKSKIIYLLLIVLTCASCASHKKLSGLEKQKSIVASGSLSVKTSSKDVTLPATVHLEKGVVARVQVFVPILGSEVGRVEFTPEHVLVVDRMDKQYVEESYSTIQSLTKTKVTFASIQEGIWKYLASQDTISFSLPMGKKVETITLKGDFKDMKADDDWEKQTTVSSKYKKVTISQISKMLQQ